MPRYPARRKARRSDPSNGHGAGLPDASGSERGESPLPRATSEASRRLARDAFRHRNARRP